jgi:hypothetical protein
MKIETVKISDIKLNPNNPRIIKDDNFKKLVKSIIDFPEMLNIRPIVVNDDMIILGGNMRFKACKEAGLKEIPIIKASNLSEDKQREFLIKDNLSGGEWDWELLQSWDELELEEWGLDVWKKPVEVDYSILDEQDVSDQLEQMTDGVKKAIQIEFESEHYNEAYQLVKFWRDQKAYVGGMIMEYLKAEKEKI